MHNILKPSRNNTNVKHVHPIEFNEDPPNTPIDERLTLLEAKKKVTSDKKGVGKRLFCEFLGTFLLTFWSSGSMYKLLLTVYKTKNTIFIFIQLWS